MSAPVTSAKALRVCHLGKYYPPARGGIETHLATLAAGQAALGARVEVVCVNHAAGDEDRTWSAIGSTPTRDEQAEQVRIVRVGRVANVARWDVCPTLSLWLFRLLRDADVVHLHTPNPTMMLALCAHPLRQPLVVTHHSDVVRQRVLGLALRPLEEWTARRATRILTTSPRYSAGSRLLSRHQRKVTSLPLGIDLAPYLEPSPQARRHADELAARFEGPLWLAVGRLVYYKALRIGLAALQRVPGRLLVIGTGPLEGTLRAEAERLGVADRVSWLGEVSPAELTGAYLAATALWFPSDTRSEGFGLVQVEAMASGLPVINTRIPDSGVAWVCPHDEAGLTVPPGDAAAFAASAQRLLDEPKLAERLGQGGRARAQTEFSSATMATRSLALYREVCP